MNPNPDHMHVHAAVLSLYNTFFPHSMAQASSPSFFNEGIDGKQVVWSLLKTVAAEHGLQIQDN